MKQVATSIVLWFALVSGLNGQSFTNLNFESAVVTQSGAQRGWLDWAVAAPGWSHSTGSDTSIIYYPIPHIGSSQWFLLIGGTNQPWSPLNGNYSLAFRSGLASSIDFDSEFIRAWIAQTGEVPLDARSIRLSAQGGLQVWLGDTEIPMQSLGGNSFAGDISSFSGTTTQLKIVDRTGWGWPLIVDDITFSPAPVPEPTVLNLVMLGLTGIVVYHLRTWVGMMSRGAQPTAPPERRDCAAVSCRAPLARRR